MTRHRLPDLVIVGAPKAGTTSLATWLGQHPGMQIWAHHEPEFLDKHYDRGLAWYAAQLPESAPGQLVGETTPGYLAYPLAPERAAAALPAARFVAVLREPVARAWSQYTFLRLLGVEHRSWEKAMAWAQRGSGPADYLGDGRYDEHLARWEAAVGADRMLVLLFDDLLRDPLGTFHEVCRFAGLADDLALPSTKAVNPTTKPRNLALQVALHRTGLSRRGAGRSLHAWNMRGGKPGSMPAAVRQRLLKQLEPANERLEQRLGRSLPASWRPAPSEMST